MNGGLGAFRFDHAILASRELEPMSERLASLGLAPEYGGLHANGVTHNALVGFDDGSYLELLSTVDPDETPPRRARLIRETAGPCGWAVGTTALEAAIERFADLGLTVDGPIEMERRTDDGELAKWACAFLGDCVPGTRYPFLIADRTPRSRRVRSSESVRGTELTGVRTVLLGVAELDRAVAEYERFFGLESDGRWVDDDLGLEVGTFEGSPVIITAPLPENEWLTERLERFGALPWGFLLETTDFDRTAARFPIRRWERPSPGRAGWIDASFGVDGRLGVVERA
ncbi:VOC family protein [Natronorubrum halophilum]|uniref:VOC family protein n=1 Tax=Natronorubrum halophilum TaxID=1702106 RepID=UPI0010C1CB47|nr:VOC family protein [Natronorubrum halophilum]